MRGRCCALPCRTSRTPDEPVGPTVERAAPPVRPPRRCSRLSTRQSEALDGRADPDLLARARAVGGRAGERLRLSGEHTVVALVGSTGSGKSTLFNALSGAELSPAGVRRPTTAKAHACVWGVEGATAARAVARRPAPADRLAARCRGRGPAGARRSRPARPARPRLHCARPPTRGRPAGRDGRPARLGGRPAEVRRRSAARPLSAPARRARERDRRAAEPDRHAQPRSPPPSALQTCADWSRATGCAGSRS